MRWRWIASGVFVMTVAAAFPSAADPPSTPANAAGSAHPILTALRARLRTWLSGTDRSVVDERIDPSTARVADERIAFAMADVAIRLPIENLREMDQVSGVQEIVSDWGDLPAIDARSLATSRGRIERFRTRLIALRDHLDPAYVAHDNVAAAAVGAEYALAVLDALAALRSAGPDAMHAPASVVAGTEPGIQPAAGTVASRDNAPRGVTGCRVDHPGSTTGAPFEVFFTRVTDLFYVSAVCHAHAREAAMAFSDLAAAAERLAAPRTPSARPDAGR